MQKRKKYPQKENQKVENNRKKKKINIFFWANPKTRSSK